MNPNKDQQQSTNQTAPTTEMPSQNETPTIPSSAPLQNYPSSAPTAPQPGTVTPTVIQPSTTSQPLTVGEGALEPSSSIQQEAAPFYQSATTPTPPAAPQVFAGGGGLVEPPKPKRNKLPFLIGGSAFAVLLLVATGVFGFYLPNTEANVWNTGLTRSGEAMDKVVIAATDVKKIEMYQTTNMKGKVYADFKNGTFTGDIGFKFDKKYSDGSASFTLKDTSEGGTNGTISGKFLSEIPDNSMFPNIYFQYSGLSQLGLDMWLPGISAYENTWIFADSQYLASLGDSYMTGTSQDEKQLTAQDVAEMVRAASAVTKEYAMTADPAKAVFIKKEFVGKERIDERSTYHYRASIDLDHAKNYCVALSRAMLDTNGYKKLSDNDEAKLKEEKNNVATACADDLAASGIKASDTFDMWIDKKYKLIHKARIYDKEDKGTYTDIGQTYKGGDQLSLFVAYHDTKDNSDGKFTLETNLKTNKTTGELTYNNREVSSPFNIKITLESTMETNPVRIEKPANAITLQELLQKMQISSQNQVDGIETEASTDSIPVSNY